MPHTDPQQARWKKQAAERAVQFIEAGMVVGLGTGSTAMFVAQALAHSIQAGLYLRGVVPNLARHA